MQPGLGRTPSRVAWACTYTMLIKLLFTIKGAAQAGENEPLPRESRLHAQALLICVYFLPFHRKALGVDSSYIVPLCIRYITLH